MLSHIGAGEEALVGIYLLDAVWCCQASWRLSRAICHGPFCAFVAPISPPRGSLLNISFLSLCAGGSVFNTLAWNHAYAEVKTVVSPLQTAADTAGQLSALGEIPRADQATSVSQERTSYHFFQFEIWSWTRCKGSSNGRKTFPFTFTTSVSQESTA